MQQKSAAVDSPGVQDGNTSLNFDFPWDSSARPEAGTASPQNPDIPAVIITLCSARNPKDRHALRRCLSVVEDLDQQLRLQGPEATWSDLQIPRLIDQWFDDYPKQKAQQRVQDLVHIIEWMGNFELLEAKCALGFLEAIHEHCRPKITYSRRNHGAQEALLMRSRSSSRCCFESEDEEGPQLRLLEG